MNKEGHRLGWVILSFVMTVCCHSAPATDPFLTLGTPTLVSNQVQFTLTGEAFASYVIESSPNAQNWLPMLTNTSPDFARAISVEAPTNDALFYRASRGPLPMFFGALVTRSNLTLTPGALIDSFDSANTNYSTPDGLYDPYPPKTLDNGNIYCEQGILAGSNSAIHGRVFVGPKKTISLGWNGCVGSRLWCFYNYGIQPGYFRDNFRFTLPDVSPPYSTGLPPTSTPTNVWHLVGGYNYMVNGDFWNTNRTKPIYVSGTGDVSVFVTGSFTNKAGIIVEPGASLKLYVGGPATLLSDLVTDGHVLSFQYYGLPGNTDVVLEEPDSCAGTVYAPEANLTVRSADSNIVDFMGSCVAKSITLNGHVRMHFDENLKRIGPMR